MMQYEETGKRVTAVEVMYTAVTCRYGRRVAVDDHRRAVAALAGGERQLGGPRVIPHLIPSHGGSRRPATRPAAKS